MGDTLPYTLNLFWQNVDLTSRHNPTRVGPTIRYGQDELYVFWPIIDLKSSCFYALWAKPNVFRQIMDLKFRHLPVRDGPQEVVAHLLIIS